VVGDARSVFGDTSLEPCAGNPVRKTLIESIQEVCARPAEPGANRRAKPFLLAIAGGFGEQIGHSGAEHAFVRESSEVVSDAYLCRQLNDCVVHKRASDLDSVGASCTIHLCEHTIP
jgi:hypothetical protein